jgi:phosphate starvation-inducible PhoH-like protein
MSEARSSVSMEGVDPLRLLGPNDAVLRELERLVPVRVTLREGELRLRGDREDVERARGLLEKLVEKVRRGQTIEESDVLEMLDREGSDAGGDGEARPEGSEFSFVFDRRVIHVKSGGQTRYIQAIRGNEIVFGIGPAGTGKTYLAVATAVQALKNRTVERVFLVRPAVEAGENLGFLPGDLQEKVDPYLRPLYDALRDMISYEKLQRFMQLGVIEIAPLAYMRGRTLSRAFVILDEAQNTTVKQMKMFLTRLGPDARAVITGDITQIDLVDPETSGLVRIQGILAGIRGIEFVYFDEHDVVRHRLVREIVRAFEDHGRPNGSLPADAPNGARGEESETKSS